MEETKKGNNLIIVIVLLCVCVLSLGGYIVFDKLSSAQNKCTDIVGIPGYLPSDKTKDDNKNDKLKVDKEENLTVIKETDIKGNLEVIKYSESYGNDSWDRISFVYNDKQILDTKNAAFNSVHATQIDDVIVLVSDGSDSQCDDDYYALIINTDGVMLANYVDYQPNGNLIIDKTKKTILASFYDGKGGHCFGLSENDESDVQSLNEVLIKVSGKSITIS